MPDAHLQQMTAWCDQLAFVQLTSPAWLGWGVLALLPPVAALLRRRQGRAIPLCSVVAQSAGLLMLAVATAGPTAKLGAEAQKPWLLLRDVSESLRGQDAQPVEPEGTGTLSRDFGPSRAAPPHTRLAGALRLAAARADELAGVVITTDGRFHDDWRPAADALGRCKLPVLIDPLDSPPADARVAHFYAGRRDGEVALRVTAIANAAMQRELTIVRTAPDEQVLLRRRLRLRANEPATIWLSDDVSAETAARYRAELSPADRFQENDSTVAGVLPIRGRVALLDARGTVDVEHLQAHTARTIDVLPPDAAPESPAGWAHSDAVVLVDPENSLPASAARSALADAVRSGTGLVLVGAVAEQTAPDRADPLNGVAPLTPNYRERKPLKVAVALDSSGSMAAPADTGGRTILDRAVEAVLTLRPQLTERDSLAVLTFAGEVSVAYDSGSEAADFGELRDALEPLTPAGPTRVLPALERAVEVLASAPAGKDRLFIVVSDLRTEQFDAAAVADLLDQQSISPAIVVTTAGERAPSDPPLEKLADITEAPLVTAERLDGLSEIFRRFLRRTRGGAVRRGEFSLTPAEGALGLSPFPLRRLRAYWLCAARPRADVLARVENDPVLAYSRSGLGRCVQLAIPTETDHQSPDVQGLSQLLRAGVERTARPEGDARFTGRLRHRNGQLEVRLEARDTHGPMNDLSLHLRAPGEEDAETTRMRQTAPGVYHAEIDISPGVSALEVTDEAGTVAWREAVAETIPREFAAIGADWSALRDLAERTDGKLVIAGGVERHMSEATERARTELWPVLLAASVAVMLIEWGARTLVSRRG
ncbi:MAG: vWA domain-containing protein [Phycisphaerae bacterium]